jgi:hypothetical protein
MNGSWLSREASLMIQLGEIDICEQTSSSPRTRLIATFKARQITEGQGGQILTLSRILELIGDNRRFHVLTAGH